MKAWLKTYKKNLLQIAGMLIAFLLTHQLFFAVLAAVLMLILLFMPGVSVRITKAADKVLLFIGRSLKKLLFSLMFLLVIIPISLLLRIFSGKQKRSGTLYISRNSSVHEMEKMW